MTLPAPDRVPLDTTALTAERLAILHDLARAFAARTALEELVPLVIEESLRVLRAQGVAVLLLDPEGQYLSIPYMVGTPSQDVPTIDRMRVPVESGLAGDVLRTGRAELVPDVKRDPRYDDSLARSVNVTVESHLAAPLIGPQGPLGVLIAVTFEGQPRLDASDLAFVEPLAASIAIAVQNARLYEQLRESEVRLREEAQALRRGLLRLGETAQIVAESRSMSGVLSLVESAARSPAAVLIEGDTGTGKELVARRIHAASDRAAAPFVAVHCAALPESLLESELFGHQRGAFTGADHDRTGLLEAASGGTVFLDEVGEMPPSMQAKLLRVFQDGEIVRLGDDRPRRIDVRFVSATHRDLGKEVEAGRFRRDLFYRLSAFPIRVPLLVERREDLPALIDRFLEESIARHGKSIRGLTSGARERLLAYEWPGNVRQLQNEIARAVALAHHGDSIDVEHLSAPVARREEAGASASGAGTDARHDGDPGPATEAFDVATAASRASGTLREARSAFEEVWIDAVLRENGGTVARAARALGISRVALHRRLAATARR